MNGPAGIRLAEFERSLTNVPPVDNEVIQRFEAIRNDAKALARTIIETTPASRHQSLALTALEESTMWAIKSIALNQDDLP